MQLTKEHKLIEIVKNMAGDEFIGDDCACLPDGTLITSDMLVEGNHFVLGETIALVDLGWKAMAVNLSDIAAMAGVPRFATVNLGLPKAFSEDQFKQLYKALSSCADTYNTKVVGGDLTSSDRLVISITVLGEKAAHGPMYRSSAKPGDVVIVTGDFGASAAGLQLLLKKQQARFCDTYCLVRHCRPSPRMEAAAALSQACGGRGALMDASDGLADALIQIAKQSNVAIQIEEARIPIHKATKSVAESMGQSAIDLALYGGEDYELVATVDPKVPRLLKSLNLQPAFTQIGVVKSGSGVACKTAEGIIALDSRKTYQHW